MVTERRIERVDFNADGFHLPNALIIAEWFVMYFCDISHRGADKGDLKLQSPKLSVTLWLCVRNCLERAFAA